MLRWRSGVERGGRYLRNRLKVGAGRKLVVEWCLVLLGRWPSRRLGEIELRRDYFGG